MQQFLLEQIVLIIFHFNYLMINHKKLVIDLIADAINDATQKAEKALVPLKQKIVGVKSVIIHDNVVPYYDSPMRASFDGFAESSMKSAPIMSGDEEIITNVSIVFYISQQ